MSFELDWLRSWVEVVDSGGFAKAANRIHLSQPRVSAHVAQLENGLGAMLIDRKKRPLTLTDHGVRFLPRARAILTAVDDSLTELRSERDVLAGRLTIASFTSASSEYLPGVIAAIRQGSPQLEVAVIDTDVSGIETALIERRAHVAVRPFRPEPVDRDLRFRALWREHFVAVAPVGHPLMSRDTVRLQEVLAHPLVTIGDPLAGSAIGHEVWSALRTNGAPTIGMVSHQPSTLAAMVRFGHGVGILNELAARSVRLDGLETRRIVGDALHRDVGLWWRADRPLTRAARAFVQLAARAPRPAGTEPLPS